jgi:hypothetical protein
MKIFILQLCPRAAWYLLAGCGLMTRVVTQRELQCKRWRQRWRGVLIAHARLKGAVFCNRIFVY